ncbi:MULTISPECIES: C-glycoside deglycosidase beta subunit domain-containing protein [Novosphingobium]|uniref:C-deglycosylation enzyme beta subunit n=1 Tax=Novosphingobium mathurense TaxID=428990 RepID=A0A1U6HZN3_9SPHN|nr:MULTISPECIES: DUF6379 domain-containing protein [Novosphingobium]CDO37947.1 conserved hypothetical protein [Novosphingobium sp. KN65.2]SLK01245.1 hypothetical protein SAMN06295987_103440 [Novosphingobium mathurense]
MLERTHIQSSGFRNTGEPGAYDGFQVRLRQPNYRGTRLSLLAGIDITVDGETYRSVDNRFVVGGREYTHAELLAATEDRWEVGTYMTVLIKRPEGLQAGVHDVSSEIAFRHPYFPPQFQPTFVRDNRKITIII